MKQYLRLFHLNFEYGRLPRQLISIYIFYVNTMFWLLPLYFHEQFVFTIQNSLFSFLNASHLNHEALKQPQAMTHPLCTQNLVFVEKQF